MQRFLISSDKFSGYVEAIYDQDSRLAILDFRNSQMDDSTQMAFKRCLSVSSETIQNNLPGCTIVAADFEITLEDFKREYPYSRNYHLLDDRWPKVSKVDQVIAFYSAIEYRKYCVANASWYNPKIADSWLAKKEYLNDWKKMTKK